MLTGPMVIRYYDERSALPRGYSVIEPGGWEREKLTLHEDISCGRCEGQL